MQGESVAEVLGAACALHSDNPRFAAVMGVSSLLLGDIPLGRRDVARVSVAEGDVLEVLPPFAGG